MPNFIGVRHVALAARDPAKLPLTKDARFTENGQTLKLGDGLWRTIGGLGSLRLDFADIPDGQAGAIVTVQENGQLALMALRLKVQGGKLMSAIAPVVNGLGTPSAIVPAAQELAKRHVAYGVTRAHYASVGAALLWTLRKGLGEAFAGPVEEAWTAAYGLLAGVMTEAAYGA